MQFTFLKNETVAFVRDDAEQANWNQEELSVNMTFPYLPEKEIERGMVILFEDIDGWQAFEVRTAKAFASDAYQQITGESLAISELTDCHVGNDEELTNVTAKAALTKALTGTGWNVGNDTSTGTSSGDFMRGNAWQCVNTVKNNWNVYITPRVTVGTNGITGRYLDISKTGGVWRGLRLSIDKNFTDPSVTYDDTDLYTALYGYGGTEKADTQTDAVETMFTNVAWSKTADHPAKPKGQKYLEYPEMTALYGRNGHPRFGYYQNVDIKDPNVLLQKTWEALKACSKPKVSITGTATDLKRLGYNDVPIRLHDMAVVEIRPINILLQLEVIQNDVNLLDPTATTPTIGDYIPNIIYINRDTEDYATGGGVGVSGRGGGGGGSRKQKEWQEFQTTMDANGRSIILNAKKVDRNDNILQQAGMTIDPITGVLIYAEDNVNNIGSMFRVTSNRITAEVAERTAQGNELKSQIKVQKDKISLVVSETSGGYKVNSASIVAGINSQHGSYIKLKADTIDLSGYVTASQLSATNATINSLRSGQSTFSLVNTQSIRLAGYSLYLGSVTIDGHSYNVVRYGLGD